MIAPTRGCVAGRRQSLRRRLVLPGTLEHSALKGAGRGEMVATTNIGRRLRELHGRPQGPTEC